MTYDNVRFEYDKETGEVHIILCEQNCETVDAEELFEWLKKKLKK